MEKQCECTIKFSNFLSEYIVYCPLHTAAFEMYEALKLLLKERVEDNHPAQSQRLAEAAIAKAEDKQ